MTICKTMFVPDTFELIEIVRADNDRYFIDYGVQNTINGKVHSSSAGPFDNFGHAHSVLKKHRPTAVDYFSVERPATVSAVEILLDQETALKLLDEVERIRRKAERNPRAYPADYAIRLISAIIASKAGFPSRNDWTERLKADKNTMYHKAYQ